MPESGTYGSVRGVPSNGRPYRDRSGLGPRPDRPACPQPASTKRSRVKDLGLRDSRQHCAHVRRLAWFEACRRPGRPAW
jgi:hypothetical protein